MRHYDAAVIGAGPGGIFTAMKLAEEGIQTVLIEKGLRADRRICPMETTCVDCYSRCPTIDGVGGAGGFSDGKLCMSPVGIDDTLVDQYWSHEVARVMRPIHTKIQGLEKRLASDCGLSGARSGMNLYNGQVLHLGDTLSRRVFQGIYDDLAVEKLRGIVQEVMAKEEYFELTVSRNQKIRTEYLILATGKCDHALYPQIASYLGLKRTLNNPQIGVRLDVPLPDSQDLVLEHYSSRTRHLNPKFKIETGEGYAKTHCFTTRGRIVAFKCGNHMLADGTADPLHPTDSLGFSVVYRPHSTTMKEQAIETLDAFSSRHPLNVLYQDLPSFLSDRPLNRHLLGLGFEPCQGAMEGDMRHLFPQNILGPLQQLIRNLEKEGLNIGAGAVYGPVAEWMVPRTETDWFMETSHPNLFTVGDVSGRTQGIIAAAVTGNRAARRVVQRVRGLQSLAS